MATHPTGRFLYMTSSSDARVYGFAVGSGGAITSIPGSPYVRGAAPGPSGIEPIAVEPSGRFVYAINRSTGTLTGYSIDQGTGALTQLVGSPFGLPSGAAADGVSLQADPTGRFLFMTTPGPAPAGNVSTLGIDPVSGAVSINGSAGPARGAGLVHIKNDGRCLYTIDPSTITHYSLNPFSGFPIEQLSRHTIQDPVSAAIDPLGRFLFVGLGLTAPQARVLGISLLEFQNSCASSSPPQSVALGSPPGSLVVDSSGRFLYVAQPNVGGSGSLSLFSTALTFFSTASTAATGQAFTGPMAMTGAIQ
ncbi:MAG: beta-propeller fold lactonase family protein [Nitrospira sp.]